MISFYARALYCFFVVRHVGTSTAQHARHETTPHNSHDMSCLSCRDVMQQMEFGLKNKNGIQLHSFHSALD